MPAPAAKTKTPTEHAPVQVQKETQHVAVAVTNLMMPASLFPHQEAFELVGFTFGKIVGTEYSDVRMPDGWTRVSNGDYRVNIFDDKGRLRVEVQRQRATLLPRYRVVEDSDQPGKVTWMVKDGDTVLYSASCGADDYAGQDWYFEKASTWLRTHYKRSDDPVAHW